MKKLLKFGALATAIAATGMASANKLTVGMSSEPTSVDPYFHNLTPNNTVAANVFEGLTFLDASEGIRPRLAESWEELGNNKLKINLRKGVKFHDGTDFTANDLVYSACRISRVKNSPSSLASEIAAWEDIEVVDDHTVIVHKNAAAPLLMTKAYVFFMLSDSAIGSKKVDFNKNACDGFEYVETAEFDSGKAAVGTGPYILDEYVKGEKMVYKKNNNYWGNKVAYDTMELIPIKSAGSRAAALLAGDVDVIEAPDVQDLDRLRADKNLKVVVADPMRTIYVMFSQKDTVPDTEGTNGKNPFLDKRVRQALSMAINRQLIVDRIMGPLGIPATNIAPPGLFGMDDVSPYEYNPEKAKKLLADAGYPNGFSTTIGSPNDRYINDDKVAQAIAQMWTRIGVKTNVSAVSRSLFFGNRNKGMYPVWLAGWGDSKFDGESFVKALSGTKSKATGAGASNPGGYSNVVIDALIYAAGNETDMDKRWKQIAAAAAIVKEDKNWVSTHYQLSPLAMKKSVDYNPPAGGERTDFISFSPAK